MNLFLDISSPSRQLLLQSKPEHDYLARLDAQLWTHPDVEWTGHARAESTPCCKSAMARSCWLLANEGDVPKEGCEGRASDQEQGEIDGEQQRTRTYRANLVLKQHSTCLSPNQ